MERKSLKALILNDDDMDCNCDEITLDHIGFRFPDLEGYDVIIYRGKKGTVTLRLRIKKKNKRVDSHRFLPSFS